MNTYKKHSLAVLATMTLVVPAFALNPGQSQAQNGTRLFPETGKTVKGKFLTYWTANGGLAQQGFPISEEMQEKSDTDGKTYTVQYFERAVFENHPENTGKPSETLLSLLGNFLYKQKYAATGAPGQKASTVNARKFTETGKTIGGKFREYWEKNGGLAQQGFPISEEFQEKNDLDGKVYTVQYFERAVMELHTENKAPFDVLLSQLGTFQYKAKYAITEVKVNIIDFKFDPKVVNVKVGTKVTWTQQDSAPHDVVEMKSIFKSAIMSKGQSYSYTFNTAGTFNYICSIHPEMTAQVVVK